MPVTCLHLSHAASTLIWVLEVTSCFEMAIGSEVFTLEGLLQVSIVNFDSAIGLGSKLIASGCRQYNMKVFTTETKVITFRGKEPMTTKIINTQTVQRISHFNYLGEGGDIDYNKNYDIALKLGKFLTICGTINHIFINKICRETNLKLYKVIMVSALPYVCNIYETQAS